VKWLREDLLPKNIIQLFTFMAICQFTHYTVPHRGGRDRPGPGVAGTLVTAAGTAVAARYLAGMGWHLALLVGTAVAATDPAVSVLRVRPARDRGAHRGDA